MVIQMKSDIQLIVDGKRIDGRAADELRSPLRITAGVLPKADGSAFIEWGKNKIVVGVYGPRAAVPRHESNPYRAIIKARYNMAPFSSSDDRIRPGPSRRSTEISKLIEDTFSNVVLVEQFPGSMIEVYGEVLQSDGGTRTATITAASVALADAGIPMKDMVAALSVGKAGGELVADIGKEEDNFGEADVPMAILPRTKEIVFLQSDGIISLDEYKKLVNMGIDACMKIYELQKDALKQKYFIGD